jgi:hypothetical protein
MMQNNDIQSRVRTILLRDWDPIGVADIVEAQDEYDQYVGTLAAAVSARRPVEDIAAELRRIETNEMGLPADESRSRRVAALLLAGR